MMRFSILILLFYLNSCASGLKAKGQRIGFLEDCPYTSNDNGVTEKYIPQVRWTFRFHDDHWIPYDQNYHNHLDKADALKIDRVLEAPSCTWRIVFRSKQLGKVQSAGLHVAIKEHTLAKGWLQNVIHPSMIPIVGHRSWDYTSEIGGEVRRPLVLVTKPFYNDHEGWRKVESSGIVPKEVIRVLNHLPQQIYYVREGEEDPSVQATHFPERPSQDDFDRQTIYLGMEYPKGTPKEKQRRDIISEDLRLDEQWVGNDGSQLFGFSFRATAPEKDGLTEYGDPVPNMIYIGWHKGDAPRYLGYTMRLVDIGDYDHDGHAEFLFWVCRDRYNGYRLIEEGFHQKATAMWWIERG